jgi:hypothetical protein
MENETPAIEVAKQMAFEAVRAKLSPQYEYSIKATEKDGGWEVLILPKGRVRGGGARVYLQGAPMQVTKIVYLQ